MRLYFLFPLFLDRAFTSAYSAQITHAMNNQRYGV